MNTETETKFKVMTATKPLVSYLISLDTSNRPKSDTTIAALKREMLEGRWTVTNQGIGVSVNGVLTDGGHRLLAMQEALETSNCPELKFMLVEGLPVEAQMCVDQGRPRTVSDVATLSTGEKIRARYIAAVNAISRFGYKNRLATEKVTWGAMKPLYTELTPAIKMLFSIPKNEFLTASVMGALIRTYHETRDIRVKEFAEKVVNGFSLESGDPALVLRNLLIERRGRSGLATQEELHLKTASALSSYLSDKKIKRLYCKITDTKAALEKAAQNPQLISFE